MAILGKTKVVPVFTPCLRKSSGGSEISTVKIQALEQNLGEFFYNLGTEKGFPTRTPKSRCDKKKDK